MPPATQYMDSQPAPNTRQLLTTRNGILYTPSVHETHVSCKVVCIDSDIKRAAVLEALQFGTKLIGRGLVRDVVELGLLKGDRLEPGLDVADVAHFELTALPFRCVFWRMQPADRLLHASLLWTIPGVSMKSIAVDLLHSWHLGGLSDYIGAALWCVVQSGVLTRQFANLPAPDAHKLGLMRLKSELWLYYRQKGLDDPGFLSKSSRAHSLNGRPQHPVHSVNVEC